MADMVNILVVNFNTLPWLKLLVNQISKYKPSIPFNLTIWDNASTDGSRAWLSSKGLWHHLHPVAASHYDGLKGAIKISDAPYVAYMDVDAFPVAHGWLEEAVAAVSDQQIGAAGLLRNLGRREFVHPSFCVFRRELYGKLSLDPSIEHFENKFTYDVGEKMCKQIEDAGYRLEFLGHAWCDSQNFDKHGNKVLHAGASAGVLGNAYLLPEWITSSVATHRNLLLRLGLWEEFLGYLRESAPLNPLCARYF